MNLIKQAQAAFRVRRQWLGEGGEPVPNEVAQRRADKCRLCPHHVNKPWEEWFKGAAANQIRKQIELKSKLELRVHRENELHMCNLCGCIMALKVHVPLSIARENTPDWDKFPSYCWLRCERPQNDE